MRAAMTASQHRLEQAKLLVPSPGGHHDARGSMPARGERGLGSGEMVAGDGLRR